MTPVALVAFVAVYIALALAAWAAEHRQARLADPAPEPEPQRGGDLFAPNLPKGTR